MPEASALCASHPSIEAAFTCARCGSFGCEACRSHPTAEVCRPCEAALFPAALRGGTDFTSLLRGTFQQIAEHSRGLVVIVGVWSLAMWLFWYFLEPSLIESFQENPDALSGGWQIFRVLMNLFLGALVSVSTMRWMADGILGRSSHSVGAALLAAFSNFPRMALLQIFYSVGVILGTISCVLPGIYLGSCWSLAPAALFLDRNTPYQALSRSFALTADRWGTMVLLLGLQVGGDAALRVVESWVLSIPMFSEWTAYLIGLPFCVGFAIEMAFFDTLYALFYLRLTSAQE